MSRENGPFQLPFPHGEIRSIIIKVQHNCMSDRKKYGKMADVPIRHEYCVVFEKTRPGAGLNVEAKG